MAKITLIDNTDPQKVFYSLKPNDDPEKDIQCGIERIEKVPHYENYNKNEFLFKHFYDKMKDSNFKCKEAIGLLVNIDEIMHDYLGYNGERNYEFSIEKMKFLSFICKEYYKDNSPLQESKMPSGAEFPSIRNRNSILQSFYLDFVEFCENSGFFNNKIMQTKKILESNLEKLRNKEIPVPFFSGRKQIDLSKIDNISSKNINEQKNKEYIAAMPPPRPAPAERGDERGDNWRGSDAYGNDPDFSGGKYRRGGEYAKDIVGF